MSVNTASLQPVLIAGRWRAARCEDTFRVTNPATRELLPEVYPVSTWSDCDEALDAAVNAFESLRCMPVDQIAEFLENCAMRIESRCETIVQQAHIETALPIRPRLRDVELPRTTNQLRQAAMAARDGLWRMPTIDTRANIRSYYAPLGPVAVFGPSNFPLAFGSTAGGDFAAAIACGNPVIGKAHSLHPGTERLLAEESCQAAADAGLPPGTVQLLYKLRTEDGCRLVSDPRIAATAFTGGRASGLKLKSAADAQGKPIFVELSSINPVVVLPGAIDERLAEISQEFTTSCLMGVGQFCTKPGLILLLANEGSEALITDLVRQFELAPVGTLMSADAQESLKQSLSTLRDAGAKVLTRNSNTIRCSFGHPNTLLRVTGSQFLANPAALQTEAFGNASLIVVAEDLNEAEKVISCLEGNLTGSIYSHSDGREDGSYHRIANILRQRVGRLLNDKMPTGVAVSPAMNHGGPFPATGHPHFTSVGLPASIRRFTMLQCFDQVRPNRLPAFLHDKSPSPSIWRLVDGNWLHGDVKL